jgi:putative SOS response-associated peptidase YedK
MLCRLPKDEQKQGFFIIMCGRFGLWATPKQVTDHFQLQEPLPFTPRYNIALSQEILVLGQTREGKRKAAWLRWGRVPHWAKEDANAKTVIALARGQRSEARGQ